MEKDKDIIIVITEGEKPKKKEKKSKEKPDVSAKAKEKPVKKEKDKPKKKSFFGEMEKDLGERFAAVYFGVCAAVIVAASIIAYNLPISGNAADKGLQRLREKDETYQAAAAEYDLALETNETLNAEILQKEADVEEYHNSQGSLDKISESVQKLEESKKTLQEQIRAKQTELDGLEASLNASSNRIVTWSSGYYTVGTDISAGTYMITGTGSIAIASEGHSTVNKLLRAEGEQFTLKEGDRINIGGTAKISPTK